MVILISLEKLRSKTWWPGMEKDVRSRPDHVEPNGITVLPNGRVTRSGIFFYEIRSDGLRHSPCFKYL